MRAPATRPIEEDDLEAVLAINQAEVPSVGALDEDDLRGLVGMAVHALVATEDGEIAGFVIALPPGVQYGSPNYRWFSDRYDDFVYVDRIAVSAAHRRRGVGHLLYDAIEAASGAAYFVCEVNILPRNEPSLAFHERRGFAVVGEQDVDDGFKRVVLLEKPLDGRSVG